MKILFVACDDKSFMKRGLIIYLKDLAKNLSQRGHFVYLFSSGRYDFKLYPYLRKIIDKEIIQYEFINSPNIPFFHKRQPYHDIYHKQIEKYFKKVLKEVNPDIVIFREFEGLCANLITVSKKFNNTKTICMLGNYSALCPEIDFYNFSKETNCKDYNYGKACIECNIPSSKRSFLSSLFLFLFHNKKNPIIKVRLINYYIIKKLIFNIGKYQNKQNRNVDSSVYRFRRKKFIEIINNCDLIIAISKRQCEIFTDHGINPNKIRVISMAMSHQDKIDFKPFLNNEMPITFGYIGRINKLKGCDILLKSFMKITNKKRCKLFLYGKIDSDFYNDNRYILNSKNNIYYKGEYSITELNKILHSIDVGIIPSIWEECYGHVGPEFLSASIPLIGSKIGGITDYLFDGKNGMLFSPGSVEDLLIKLNTIISDPDLILQMKNNIIRETRYLKHIDLMETIFLNICSKDILSIKKFNLTSWVH